MTKDQLLEKVSNSQNKNFIPLTGPQKTRVCWRGCYISPSPWENGSGRSGIVRFIGDFRDTVLGPPRTLSSGQSRSKAEASTSSHNSSEQGVQTNSNL
ncbi:hypothetical protein BpHYR1_019421 [Brachionus plicatilis]|uniref:Uncharacterized protein n=1 Tax=Brachionus plicatilis TaxID=10195 RepID=A0A3M7RD76_BRAPC|nr:hypothetical protein BpHYR1_019421 [Brachionus plicatilis]